MRNHVLTKILSAILSLFRKKRVTPQIPYEVDLEEVQTFHFIKFVDISYDENKFTVKSKDAGSLWLDSKGRYRAEYTEGPMQGHIWVWDGHLLQRYSPETKELSVHPYDSYPTPYAFFDHEALETTMRNIQNNSFVPTNEPRTYESVTTSNYVKVRLNESQTLIESIRQYSEETLTGEYEVVAEEHVLKPNSDIFKIKLSGGSKVVYYGKYPPQQERN
ncbi:hypothetical protein YDYSG_54790 [Paenibacillus tyrfis]|uniref:hypothetical protein n=1 Tax=Paenibacillus tyrfis TaxID=1501230 RepID=UPI002490789D|nr:hypothetical protein [Paenibacillus tyrfis]GLI09447.1 hypothetical protein YDYSG_54790 [Paenibacillus tyrfis]